MTLLHHIPNQATWFLKTINSHKYEERRIDKYMINRLYMAFFISHAISTLNPYYPSGLRPWANMICDMKNAI